MRVNSVSLVFQRDLNQAGMTPHSAPAAREAPAMQRNSIGAGRLLPRYTITSAVARPPMRIWPSPPQFQKRILKAGARPMPTQSSVTRSRSIQLNRVGLAKVPPHMTP